ncbi:MAG: PqqD family protein [Bacteroidales bacterium]|nr:PqqD family protein [Bacteroidales bacterium]
MKTKKGFKMRTLLGEHIIVAEGLEQVNFNKMISLNESAAYLWEAVEKKDSFSVDDLKDLLLAEYEVEEKIAAEDAKAIAERWIEIGIAEE